MSTSKPPLSAVVAASLAQPPKPEQPEIQLSDEQKAVVAAFKEKKNLLVTGSAGTGKSTLLKAMIEETNGRLQVWASTGIAAVNVGGLTIHSAMGLGLAKDDAETLAGRILDRKGEAYSRICNFNRVAIDEISMVSREFFTKIDHVMRLVRKVKAPFGGMQMVLFGDFLQLPPVTRDLKDDTDRFAFSSPSWEEGQFETHLLTKVFRQEEADFSGALNDIRLGQLTERARLLLTSRFGNPADTMPGILPVTVFTHNADVDAHNAGLLEKITEQAHFFEAIDTGEPAQITALQKHCLAPTTLELKVGAQVMLLKNLDPIGGLANGSIGAVTGFNEHTKFPEVKFANGKTKTVEQGSWEIKDAGVVRARRSQVPLRLAWSVTAHKCLHPDTLIETGGGLERIGEIEDYDGEGFIVVTADGHRNALPTVRNPIGPGFRITTVRGYEIRATPTHGFVVTDADGVRRVNAEELQIGDTLRLVRGPTDSDTAWTPWLHKLPPGDVRAKEYKTPVDLNLELCEFLGMMVADGTVFKKGFRMAKRHKDVADRFADLARSLFDCKPKRFFTLNAHHVEVSSTRLVDWLLEFGGLAPKRKAIPDLVLRSMRVKQCAFLKGLFEDGGVSLKKRSFSSVEWTTKSGQMASDVQVMLLRLGIVSSRAFYKTAWRVMIYGANAAVFSEKIGFISKIKQDKLNGAGSRDKQRGVVLERFVPEQIKSIEPIEMESVCFEVPDYGRFVQGGFDGFNCQGMTLDKIEVYLDRVFEDGQAYVALSRARTKDGLFIRSSRKGVIRANKEALAFYGH